MESKVRKQKYLDRLKKTCSKEQKKNIEDFDIQYDNSTSFNESHQQFTELKCEPNDLLAKVERYIKANPMSHITKNRLSLRKGLYQHRFQSNTYSRSKDKILNKIENVISFMQPKEKIVNYKPDSNIIFGPPNATSTINYQQPLFQKRNCKSTKDSKNNEHDKNEKIHLNESLYNFSNSSSSRFIMSTNNRNNLQGLACVLLDQERNNKNKSLSIEDKEKLNLTHYLYLEFVHLHCNELKKISENVYPNNDYRINLKRQLQRITFKHENKLNAKDTHLTSSSDLVSCNKSMNIVDYTSSGSIFNCSDFNFDPANNLSYVSDTLRTSQFSLDSFVCSTQETSSTYNKDSMEIDNVKLELNEEYFSSPNISWNENNYNQNRQKVSHPFNSDQTRSITNFPSFDSNSEEFIQKLNNNQDSILNFYSGSSSSSEDSFKLY